jgi:hypothetical protein
MRWERWTRRSSGSDPTRSQATAREVVRRSVMDKKMAFQSLWREDACAKIGVRGYRDIRSTSFHAFRNILRVFL